VAGISIGGIQVAVYDDLYVRTQYDGKDLMSVEEIYHYDDDGEEEVCNDATGACIDIATCADQGRDLWSWLRAQIEGRLQHAGIKYKKMYFEDERGN
jgi:hypothetical protein